MYFENRFEFYDLVVKRAMMMLMSMVVLGVYFAVALPWLEAAAGRRGAALAVRGGAGADRDGDAAGILARNERWLDRIWLGREFTPVEAVKHVLAAMQPATDEATLIEAAEARLSEIFGAKMAVLVGSTRDLRARGADRSEADQSGVGRSGAHRRAARSERTRRFLSEDLALLRSLGGVFGFMLENIRLQRKRLEQEQLAQELRLQSSKSELKALRAQINPHFLFNALNAIASLIHTDPARADEVVEQLAEVFRYTLRRSDTGMGAARSGARLRARLSRRRAGALRPAADLHDRFRSPLAGAAGAVDAAADAARERGQARRVAGARARPHRGDRAHHARAGHARSAQHRPPVDTTHEPAQRTQGSATAKDSACTACANG